MAKKKGRAGAKAIGTTKRARAVAAARVPEVVLDVECEGGRAHLVLANTGDAAAIDVRVSFSRPLEGVGEVRISDLALFRGLGLLRPGREFRVFWDATPRLFESKRPIAFEAVVMWRDVTWQEYRASYRHDLAVFRQLPESLSPFKNAPPPLGGA